MLPRTFTRSAPALVAAALLLFPQAAGGELNTLVISQAGASASGPRVASDSSGNVVAIWREADGDDASIRAAARPEGGTWGSANRISSTTATAEAPELAMDRQGNAVAVWQHSEGRRSVVQAAVRPAGGPWSSPRDLSPSGELAFEPDVAVERGRATVVWTAKGAVATIVKTTTGPIAGAWSAPEVLSDPAADATAPVVSMDDRGGAVAAWQAFDGAHLGVAGAVLSADGEWSAPEFLSSAGQHALRPRVAMDAVGNAAAGWVRPNGSWIAAQVTYRPAGGDWQVPKNLSNRSGNAAAVDVVMNRRGDALVSWRQGQTGSSSSNLWSSSRAAGASRWGARVLVNESWQGLRAQAALDEAGNATVVWAGSAAIFASFKPAGEAWQQDYLLSDWEFPSVHPAVAIHAPRNATAVWVRAGEDDDRVETVVYDVNTSSEENEEDGEETDDEVDDDEGEVFKGTLGADTLIGTPGNDVFFGYDGNDRIFGRGGRDRVYGGPGNDRIFGGRGHDRLFGGADHDRLVGGRGHDVLAGDWGRDLLSGGVGDDTLLARDGRRDRAFGGRGYDRFRLDRWLDRARSVESRL